MNTYVITVRHSVGGGTYLHDTLIVEADNIKLAIKQLNEKFRDEYHVLYIYKE